MSGQNWFTFTHPQCKATDFLINETFTRLYVETGGNVSKFYAK